MESVKKKGKKTHKKTLHSPTFLHLHCVIGEIASHLGKLLFERLQHIVHGAFAVFSWRHTDNGLAVHGNVPGLNAQLGHTYRVTHGFSVHL